MPARVYARPLDVFPGAKLSPKQLESELAQLTYRRLAEAGGPASWSRSGNRYSIHTRPFLFWDAQEPAHRLEVEISEDRVTALLDHDRPVDIVRLEAVEIGSIFPASKEDRVIIKREAIPDLLIRILVAVEDQDFYEHHGIDPSAILRAAWINIRSGDIKQGGSTLTQQLVKNFYLTDERTLTRKVKEALMSVMLDFHYNKDDILEAYANEIYLGQDGSRAIHGFGLASYFYFNLPLGELDLSRMALLVALVRGPSWYDPVRHPERALTRRNLIIDKLQQKGIVDAASAEQARRAGLGLNTRLSGTKRTYPAFMSLLKQQLRRDYREEDLSSEGLRIFTTLDPWVQEQAEQALRTRLYQIEADRGLPDGELQGALVAARRDSGEILAIIGDRQVRYAGFNRALDSERPIGSLIKPAVYLTALMQPERYTLVTPLNDEEIEIDTPAGAWKPKNYDGKMHGMVPLHEALAKSYNLATIHLGLALGTQAVTDTLRKLGVQGPVPQVPAMFIGAVSMSPLEVTQMYQTLAAGGFYSPLRAIREIQAADGTPLQRYPLEVRQSVPEGPVYLLNRNLQEVVSNGTAQSLSGYLSGEYDLGGKTGTTNELRDSWFAGISGDKIAVVWLGRDDDQPAGLTGASGALQVYGDVLRRTGLDALELIQPDDVELKWVDLVTGELTGSGCKNAMQFPFITGSSPEGISRCISNPVQRLFRKIFR